MISKITKSKNDSLVSALEKRIVILEKILINLNHIADNNKDFSERPGDFASKTSQTSPNTVFNENIVRGQSTIRLTNNQMIAELAAAIRRVSQRNL